MCGNAHVFLATSGNNRRIAKLDVLGAKGHGTKARTTNLIDPPSGALNRQACVDVCLACRVLALRCGQNLTENSFAYFRFVDASAGNNRL